MTKEVKNIFTESEKVLAEYKEKVEELTAQEKALNAELVTLQEEMTANMLEQENADISERVYLKIQSKKINNTTEVINKLLEELDEELTALKLHFTPILKETLAKDRRELAQYNATEIVEKYRDAMLTEIAELGKEMQSQYHAIAPDVMEIFDDSTVKKAYPTIYHSFNQEQYTPPLQWSNEAVVHKNDIFLAKSGRLPQGLKQPKDVN